MDCRLTLGKGESFLEMLQSSYLSGQKSYLLYDENGMTRAEGFIKAIHVDAANPAIEMEDGLKIALKDIIACNGIFLPEYGEC
jgi:hypothetical protein